MKTNKLEEEQKQWGNDLTHDAVQQAQHHLQKCKTNSNNSISSEKWQNDIHQQKTQVIQQQREINNII